MSSEERQLDQAPPPLPERTFGRLHPSSILFSIVAQVRTFLIPGIIAAYATIQGNSWGLVLGILVLVPTVVLTLVFAVIRFFSFRYGIRGSDLVVTQGVLFRRVRTVPLQRIQNINLVQNPLHRMARVAEARIETASGTEPEAVLQVISLADVQALRDSVFGSSPTADSDAEATTSQAENCVPEIELVRIPTKSLVRAGVANNRGLVLVGVLVGLSYQLELYDRINLEMFTGVWEQSNSALSIALLSVTVALGALLLLRLLSVGWYILRFYDYRLVRMGDDLQIRCGLFTKVSASVPRRRIQLISVQQNLWMKWMGVSSVRIETAGGSGSEDEGGTTAVSSRWFVPVLPDAAISTLIPQLREGLVWQPENLEWHALSPDTAKRLTRLAAFVSIPVGLIGLANVQPWGVLLGVVVLVPLLWLARRTSRAMRYARTQEGVVFRSGLFTKKMSVTFFDRIQTVRVDESPFDRRWRMAQLSVDTAAAGPAQHTIRIPFLPAALAQREFRYLRGRVSAN